MREPPKTLPDENNAESQTPGAHESSPGSTPVRPRSANVPNLDPPKPFLKPQEAQLLLEQLRESCVAGGDLARPLEAMIEDLNRSGYKQDSASILRRALESPTVRPEVGALWMRRVLNRRSWDRHYPEEMDELCRRGEVGRRAVIEFLETASTVRKPELVRRALRKHGNWLREHPIGWGAVVRALATVHCYRALSRWMSDWRERPELDLSLVHCLVAGLRGSGRVAESKEVIRVALAKHATDPRLQPLKLWHAMDEALAGNTDSAASLFKEFVSPEWDKDSFNRYYLVRGMIRVQKANKESRAEASGSAWTRIEDHFRRPPIYQRDLLVRREYRQCMCRIARDAGYWPGRIRATWRSADSWPFLIPLLLVPGLQLLLPLYLFRLCTHRQGKS